MNLKFRKTRRLVIPASTLKTRISNLAIDPCTRFDQVMVFVCSRCASLWIATNDHSLDGPSLVSQK
jgi:hypothetical protein